MVISDKSFTFKSANIDRNPVNYSVNWSERCTFDGKSVITISRKGIIASANERISFTGSELLGLIKDLQTLAEFMKNDGLLDEKEDNSDDDQDSH